MKQFFSTILRSWGHDTPQEVFWALNHLLEYAKSKGFTSTITYFSENNQFDDDVDIDNTPNDQLVEELTIFFDNLK